MINYPQIRDIPSSYIRSKLDEFYREDYPMGDATTEATVPEGIIVDAFIETQQDLIFVGEEILIEAFNDMDIWLKVTNGERLETGRKIIEIRGDSRQLLMRERVILNLLQRLCGIATKTAEYVKIAKPHGVKILDTRKTTPGLRLFEKYAVSYGGGYNHRLDLSTGFLIKDNHLKAIGGIAKAVEYAKKAMLNLPIEVEVDNINQIKEAIECGVDAILLDNFLPDEAMDAVAMIRAFGKDIFIEASGGITLINLNDYVRTGINAISIGALTHRIQSADMHLEFV